jgi:hypothetical protein
LKLTLRETEERCAQVAQQWGNDAYRISASWLDRVERENRGLSATKLIVLAYIYNLSTDQMLSFCPGSNEGSAQLLQASAHGCERVQFKYASLSRGYWAQLQ